VQRAAEGLVVNKKAIPQVIFHHQGKQEDNHEDFYHDDRGSYFWREEESTDRKERKFFFSPFFEIDRDHHQPQDYKKEEGIGRDVEVKLHQAMAEERYRANKTTKGYAGQKRVSSLLPLFDDGEKQKPDPPKKQEQSHPAGVSEHFHVIIMGVLPEGGGNNGFIFGIDSLKITQPDPNKGKVPGEGKGIFPNLEPIH
jgi:hypothetical protein